MIILLILLLVAGAVIVAIGWGASGRAIHPPQNVYPWSLSDYPELNPQPVTFVSRDGIALSGRFYSGTNGATIVLSHGYGDNKDQMIPWVDFLHQAGFNAFTYDMRDRGESAGCAVTLGANEWIDLISAVDYLVTRDDVEEERIGAFGVSLGGSVSIMVAARDERIKAVVNDSGFSDAANVISRAFQMIFRLPSFPFAPVTVKIAEWRTGASVRDVHPAAVIGEISPRPILLIHGTSDSLVPPRNAERNFAAAKEPKELWWVEDADHVEAGLLRPDEYKRRIVEFYGRWLNVPVDRESAVESLALEVEGSPNPG